MFFNICSSEECDKDDEIQPFISMLELRIHLNSFINSAIDYDPEISILFDGGSQGGSGCGSSDEYNVVSDYVFWLSISTFIVVCCIVSVIICIGSTDKGRQIISGRQNMKLMMKEVERRSTMRSSSTLSVPSSPTI